MNITELVSSIEREAADNTGRQETINREINGILDAAKRENRLSLTAGESARSDALFRDLETARAAGRRISERLSRARTIEAEEADVDRRSRAVRDSGAKLRKYDEVARIGSEKREYNPGNDPKGVNFALDVIRAQVNGDPAAWARLNRHMQEERVERPGYEERVAGDLLTTGLGGIVVPQYLVDLTAPAIAARRPFADAVCTKHQLPATGMTFTIPTITTATSAAIQTTQLSAVSATSMAETDLTINVLTIAGQQNVSRQAADRSQADEFVISDLFLRYATTLDSTLLTQATTGLSAKAVATTYDDTQPTGAKLYPKLLAAQAAVEAALLGGNASHVVMHSRRWAWLSKEMTSTWPIINSQNIPVQAGGVSTNADYGAGVRGYLPNGMAVVVDNNIATNLGVGTNQDEIYVVPAQECHLWEDANAPMLIRAEQPNAPSLGILLVVYGYVAYTFARYSNGMQKVAGTSLVTPVF
jgi:hypothetical protein